MNRVATIGNVLAADSGPGLTPRQIGGITRADVIAAIMPSNAGGPRQAVLVSVDRNGPEASRTMLHLRAAISGNEDTSCRVEVWAVNVRTGSNGGGDRSLTDGTIWRLGTATIVGGAVVVGSSGGAGQIPAGWRWAKLIQFSPSPEYQAVLAAMGRGNPVEIDPAASALENSTPAALILPAPAGAEALLLEAYGAVSGGTAPSVAVDVGTA
jgi:hypothetical protein